MATQKIPKHLRKWRKEAEQAGWTVRRMKNGHWQFKSGDGQWRITVCHSPSDHRSILNDRAQLRRAGLKVN
jgi:predicted RNA binding protein YcfA (HicA-like mRNA interferase family)